MEKYTVADYMSKSVQTVTPEMNISDASDIILDTGHDGFPVCSDGRLVGYITARDVLIGYENQETVSQCMEEDYPVFESSMKVKTAGRIMFREGKSEIPVIDKDGHLVGIMTNTDVIRSQIEKTTPRKVDSISKMLSDVHDGIVIEEYRDKLNVNNLTPTQTKIYMDELIGRKYEIKQGLAEPIVVVKTPKQVAIADGHHRAVAARKIDKTQIDSYVIDIKQDINLGMIQQARDNGLQNLEDIEIIRSEDHPTIQKIKLISDISVTKD